jgi:hypothetical protein
MILMKIGDEYKLYSHDSCIATTQESPYKKLSKQNCDEIFGVVDVEILSDEYSHDSIWFNKRGTYNNQEFFEFIAKKSFTDGFIKAMELNKDKLFTVEDMKKAYIQGKHGGKTQSYVEFDDFIQSLQHPKEIEVDVEMETKKQLVNGYKNQPDNVIGFIAEYENVVVPKLDENGCLILKRK